MPLPDPLRRLRLAGGRKGTTLLLRLGGAMPLKPLAGMPGPASVPGPAAGVAMVACLVALVPWGTLRDDRGPAGREAAA